MSDIPEFGVHKGMMTSHEESIVSKAEYTDANREKLAEAVVENMELKDMIQALYEQELECYERCEDTFQEQWHNYYGDDDLRAGDEVYWNDPDEGACSGHGVFVRYDSDGVAVIRKDDVEIEVFVKELS
jgi:hypothetical protein